MAGFSHQQQAAINQLAPHCLKRRITNEGNRQGTSFVVNPYKSAPQTISGQIACVWPLCCRCISLVLTDGPWTCICSGLYSPPPPTHIHVMYCFGGSHTCTQDNLVSLKTFSPIGVSKCCHVSTIPTRTSQQY